MAPGNNDLEPRRRRRTLLIRILTAYIGVMLGSVCNTTGILIVSFSFSSSPLWKRLLSWLLGVVLILVSFIICFLVHNIDLFWIPVDADPSADEAELTQLIPWPREESTDDGDHDGVQENHGRQGGGGNGVQESPWQDANNDGVMPTATAVISAACFAGGPVEISASHEGEADGAAGSGRGTLVEGFEAGISRHTNRQECHRRSTQGIGF